nr:ATP-dependent DNA helicase PIF1-like [Tanacetum cinerariifolium]
MDNRLIREALDFDVKKSKAEHQQLHSLLNPEQRVIYEDIVQSVHNKKRQLLLCLWTRGTEKTFLYRIIISRLRSEQKIILAVASLGIASLLLPAGRTAHSRFVIPLELMENSTCGIKQNTQLAKHTKQATQTLGRKLANSIRKDFTGHPKGKRLEVAQACIYRSELWRYCKVYTLTRNTEVNEFSKNREIDTSKQEFNKWVLAVGDGTLPAKKKEGGDEPTWIDIPKKFLIKKWDCPIRKIVEETYLDLTIRQTNDEYLKERAILTPRNEDADAINEFMFKKLSGETGTYNSADEICKASTDNIDHHQLYPVEFLNSLNFPGMPPHELCLKKNYPSCYYGISIQARDYAIEQD